MGDYRIIYTVVHFESYSLTQHEDIMVCIMFNDREKELTLRQIAPSESRRILFGKPIYLIFVNSFFSKYTLTKTLGNSIH